MSEYSWKCSECGHCEITMQSIKDELITPHCSEHGPMNQIYNFGVGRVFGAGSSPNRPSLKGD